MDHDYSELIDRFVDENIEGFKADLKRLVDIKSVAGKQEGTAPYGLGVAKALHEALTIAGEAGLKPTDCDGHIGYAHYGDEDRFIGIIGHIDVVPEGNGWNTDPYNLVECGGYLLGRGTEDDKGGFMIGLYAVKFLIENGVPLRYGIRLLAGCDEEVGMSDIEYYKAHCKMPLFTMTPDAEFPVCCGEKGIYSADLISRRPVSDSIIELRGGVASNAVPDLATALLDCPLEAAQQAAQGADHITVRGRDGRVTVIADGISAHAGEPAPGLSAIVLLCRFLAGSGLVPQDSELLAAIVELLEVNDGSRFGIASDDGIFTPLTIIGGMISLDEGRHIVQNLNCRYPTSITDAELNERIAASAGRLGYELANVQDGNPPHYIPADSPAIGALMNAYNEVTGRSEKPYVMSGGTYARHIPNAVAFGINFDGSKKPDFVGSIHGKNEGYSIESAKAAIKIYIRALIALQNVEL